MVHLWRLKRQAVMERPVWQTGQPRPTRMRCGTVVLLGCWSNRAGCSLDGLLAAVRTLPAEHFDAAMEPGVAKRCVSDEQQSPEIERPAHVTLPLLAEESGYARKKRLSLRDFT